MEKGFSYSRDFVYKEGNANGENEFFLFASNAGSSNQIPLEDIESYENTRFRTFDDFKNVFRIWKITFPRNAGEWKLARCTCPAFGESFICKHIIGIANRIGALEGMIPAPAPPNYDDEPLFATKRGKPKRATSALVKDK